MTLTTGGCHDRYTNKHVVPPVCIPKATDDKGVKGYRHAVGTHDHTIHSGALWCCDLLLSLSVSKMGAK